MLHILRHMDPKQTNEKRKLGPISVLATVSVALVVMFELSYIVMGSFPDNRLFSHFSPAISDDDMTMLYANMPGRRYRKKTKSEKPKKAEPEAATAVDAALQKSGAFSNRTSNILLDDEGVPSAIAGADNIQWTVVNTNELKELVQEMIVTNAALAATNDLLIVTNGLHIVTNKLGMVTNEVASITNGVGVATNAVPESVDTDEETTDSHEIKPVG